MTLRPRFIAIAAALVAALMAFALPQASRAAEFSKAQTTEIEKVVRDYLLKNPEVIEEAIQELQKRQQAAEAAKHKDAVKTHAEQLFSSQDQVVLGNPKGNVTFVEFFDYNCGYCKRAMTDMLTLLKTDPELKILLKEFPVLGEASVEAARVAMAVRAQAPKRYLEFHTKLMGARGRANEASALAVAKEMGLDIPRVRKDMKDPEVEKALRQDFALAQALGLNGTPSYVIGDEVVVGAVGLDTLKQNIAKARCGKESC